MAPGNHPLSKISAPSRQRVFTLSSPTMAMAAQAVTGLAPYPRSLGSWRELPSDRHMPRSGFSSPSKEDSMAVLRKLVEEGKITPVVGKMFPLAEAVQAIRYLADGRSLSMVLLMV